MGKTDYISKKLVVDMLKEITTRYNSPDIQRCDYLNAISRIENLPAVEIHKEVQGEWIDVFQDGLCSWSGKCSVCGVRNDIPPLILAHFCPNCGARMV